MKGSLDPYRFALALLRERIRWDFRREALRSRRRLQRLRRAHPDGTAVVLCNGPSLLRVDFGLLDGAYTFGLNKINLLFEKTAFRPSCIVAVNPYVIEQNAAFYRSTDIPLFLDSGAAAAFGAARHITYLHSIGVREFAEDVAWSLWQGHTVTFVALQLAFHMGFRRVALVGCDHDFAVKGSPNELVVSRDKDESHFHPGYFAPGMSWQLPDLRQSEISYLLAAEAFERAGGQLVNATSGGRLEILPRMELRAFLGKESPRTG